METSTTTKVLAVLATILITLLIGIYLGSLMQASKIIQSCGEQKEWSYDAKLLDHPIEITCELLK